MPLTRKNIRYHELIGLQASVESQSCPDYTVEGKIVDETKNMVTIMMDDGSTRRVPKRVTTFHLHLPDNAIVVLEGESIMGRPEDRIKKIRRKRK